MKVIKHTKSIAIRHQMVVKIRNVQLHVNVYTNKTTSSYYDIIAHDEKGVSYALTNDDRNTILLELLKIEK